MEIRWRTWQNEGSYNLKASKRGLLKGRNWLTPRANSWYLEVLGTNSRLKTGDWLEISMWRSQTYWVPSIQPTQPYFLLPHWEESVETQVRRSPAQWGWDKESAWKEEKREWTVWKSCWVTPQTFCNLFLECSQQWDRERPKGKTKRFWHWRVHALVHLGCFNYLPQIEWLINHRNWFFTVLEAGKSTIKGPWFYLVRAHFPVHRW